MFFGDIIKGANDERDRQTVTRRQNMQDYAAYVQANPNATTEERERFSKALGPTEWERSLLPSRDQMKANYERSQKEQQRIESQLRLKDLQERTAVVDNVSGTLGKVLLNAESPEAAEKALASLYGDENMEVIRPLISDPSIRTAALTDAIDLARDENELAIVTSLSQGLPPDQFGNLLRVKNPDVKSAVQRNYEVRWQAKQNERTAQINADLQENARTAATPEQYEANRQTILRQAQSQNVQLDDMILQGHKSAFDRRMKGLDDEQSLRSNQAFDASMAVLTQEGRTLNSEDAFVQALEDQMATRNAVLTPEQRERALRSRGHHQSLGNRKAVLEANREALTAARTSYQEMTTFDDGAINSTSTKVANDILGRAAGENPEAHQAIAIPLIDTFQELTIDLGLPVADQGFQYNVGRAAKSAIGDEYSDAGEILGSSQFYEALETSLIESDDIFDLTISDMVFTDASGNERPMRLSMIMRSPDLKRQFRAAYERNYKDAAVNDAGYIQRSDLDRTTDEAIAHYEKRSQDVTRKMQEIEQRIGSLSLMSGEDSAAEKQALLEDIQALEVIAQQDAEDAVLYLERGDGIFNFSQTQRDSLKRHSSTLAQVPGGSTQNLRKALEAQIAAQGAEGLTTVADGPNPKVALSPEQAREIAGYTGFRSVAQSFGLAKSPFSEDQLKFIELKAQGLEALMKAPPTNRKEIPQYRERAQSEIQKAIDEIMINFGVQEAITRSGAVGGRQISFKIEQAEELIRSHLKNALGL